MSVNLIAKGIWKTILFYLYKIAIQVNVVLLELIDFTEFTESVLLFSAEQLDLFYLHEFTLIPSCISKYTPSKMCDEITHPFPNFNRVDKSFHITL